MKINQWNMGTVFLIQLIMINNTYSMYQEILLIGNPLIIPSKYTFDTIPPFPCLGVYDDKTGGYDKVCTIQSIIEMDREKADKFKKTFFHGKQVTNIHAFLIIWTGNNVTGNKLPGTINILFHDFVRKWFCDVKKILQKSVVNFLANNDLYEGIGYSTNEREDPKYDGNMIFEAVILDRTTGIFTDEEDKDRQNLLNQSVLGKLHLHIHDKAYSPNNAKIKVKSLRNEFCYESFFLVGFCENRNKPADNLGILTFNIIRTGEEKENKQLLKWISDAKSDGKTDSDIINKIRDNIEAYFKKTKNLLGHDEVILRKFVDLLPLQNIFQQNVAQKLSQFHYQLNMVWHALSNKLYI